MKKLTITLLFTPIYALLFSQSAIVYDNSYVLDSVITTSGFYGFGVFITAKDAYNYNNSLKIVSIENFANDTYYLDTITWIKFEETIYTYQNEIELIQILNRELPTGGNELENNHMWSYINSEYDTIMLLSYWENEEWRQQLRITKSYNPVSYYHSFLKEYTNDITNEWEYYSRNDTIFNSNNLLDTIKSFHWNNSNNMDTLSIKRFSYTNYPDTTTAYIGIYDTLQIEKQYFDSTLVADVNLVTIYNPDMGVFEPLYRRIYYYDNDQNQIKYEWQNWNITNNSWEVNRYIDYIYNNNNQVIEKNSYSVTGCSKTTYEYNTEDLLSVKVHYEVASNTDEFKKYEYYYTQIYVDIPHKPQQKTCTFPNPATSHIVIDNSNTEYQNYFITSLQGIVLKSGTITVSKERIDISSIPEGLYIMNLKGKQSKYSQIFLKL